MYKFLKFSVAVIGLAIALVAIVVTLLTFVIDPNEYKPQIIAEFKEATGYNLELPTPLKWSYYPHLGLQAEEVRIANPPIFTVVLKKLTLHLRWAALLHKRIELSKLYIDELAFNTLQATQVDAKLEYQDPLIDLQPIKAKIYGGNLDANLSIKNQDSPTYHLVGSLNDMNMTPFIQGLTGKADKLTLEGRGTVAVDLNSQGKTTEAFLRGMNGISRINLNQGAVIGIDLGYYIDSAAALLDKKPLPPKPELEKTPFGQLTATAMVKNGIALIEDLVIDSNNYLTKGSGSIDLATQAIDYHLQITAKPGAGGDVLGLYGKTIAVDITGTLDNPSVSLDTMALIKQVGQEQLNKVGDKIEKVAPGANQFLQKLFH